MTIPQLSTPEILEALKTRDLLALTHCMGQPPRLDDKYRSAGYEMALAENDSSFLEVLLRAPLNQSERGISGSRSLLHTACTIKDLDGSKITLLMAAGCSHLLEDSMGHVALDLALKVRNYCGARALVDAGGYTSPQHAHAWTLLVEAPRAAPADVIIPMVDQFIAMGFDVNENYPSGFPLALAAGRGNREIARHLVTRGANPHQIASSQWGVADGPEIDWVVSQYEAYCLDHGTHSRQSSTITRRI